MRGHSALARGGRRHTHSEAAAICLAALAYFTFKEDRAEDRAQNIGRKHRKEKAGT